MNAKPVSIAGDVLIVEAYPDGRSRYPCMVFTTAGHEPELLVQDTINLAKEADRQALVARVPDELAGELSALLPTLATDIVRQGPAPKAEAKAGSVLSFEALEPWPTAVDGAALLDALAAFVARFIVLPEGAGDALALWTLFCWTHDCYEYSPILAVNAPTRACGKTRVHDTLECVVPRPSRSVDPSNAALYRVIELHRPTLLIDEADNLDFHAKRDLRALLNSGHARRGASILRCDGDTNEVREFSTWAPKSLAGIGELPDTTRSRAIGIRMRRKGAGERTQFLRTEREIRAQEGTRRQALRWATDHAEALREADPSLPDALSDRARDNWRPLAAVADAAGGLWPARMRAAALVLSGAAAEEEDAPGELLLADLRELFRRTGTKVLRSAEILEELHKLEARPWSEWSHGRPLSAKGLASLLRPFKIKSADHRLQEAVVKGYAVSDFADAFGRYLRPVADGVAANVAGESGPKPIQNNVVAAVADPSRGDPPPVCGLCEGTQRQCVSGAFRCESCDGENQRDPFREPRELEASAA